MGPCVFCGSPAFWPNAAFIPFPLSPSSSKLSLTIRAATPTEEFQYSVIVEAFHTHPWCRPHAVKSVYYRKSKQHDLSCEIIVRTVCLVSTKLTWILSFQIWRTYLRHSRALANRLRWYVFTDGGRWTRNTFHSHSREAHRYLLPYSLRPGLSPYHRGWSKIARGRSDLALLTDERWTHGFNAESFLFPGFFESARTRRTRFVPTVERQTRIFCHTAHGLP